MKTMRLNWETWDLELDATGMLSPISSEPEYCAQTVANACRMFRDDAYFYKDEGIPYFENVLGRKPPQSLVEAYLREAAMNVPLVKKIHILDYERKDRVITGQIRIFTENGSKADVSI